MTLDAGRLKFNRSEWIALAAVLLTLLGAAAKFTYDHGVLRGDVNAIRRELDHMQADVGEIKSLVLDLHIKD